MPEEVSTLTMREKLKSVKAVFAVACLVAGGQAIHAQTPSLGFNFASTDPDAATSSLDPSEAAGVVPAANWNNLTGATGSGTTGIVYDQNGTATPSSATVTWSSPNTWRSGANNLFPDGPDKKLVSGYLDTGDTATNGITITVNNIDSVFTTGGYDVYVYFVSDSGANRGGAYTINDGNGPVVKYGSSMASPTEFVQDPGTDVNLSQDGNYLRFIGMKGASLTLTTDTTLTTPNGFRAPVNAVQIVPTPQFGPDFTAAPRSVSIYSGRTARFTAAAEGYPAITSLQWQKNGVNVANDARISGATTGTLTINNATQADAGTYTLVATSPRGSATSTGATLAIVPVETSDYVTALNTAGPVAHWRLNELETSTNAFDFIGGWTGTYSDTVVKGTSVAGPRPTEFSGFSSDNTAAEFPSVPGQVNVPTPTLATNTATFITWINPSFTQSDYTGLFMTRTGTQAGLGYTTDNQLGYTWNNNTTWSWQSGLRPPDAQWSMVALVVQADKATLYLGATGAVTAAINPIAHTAETWGELAFIGNDTGGATRYFQGRIDEVAVFNRALSFQEIAGLYEEATGIPQALPPTVSPHPQDATLFAGATVQLKSGAVGATSYQWQKNGVNVANDARISGATTDTLTITGLTATDAGDYTLVASNAQGPTTSEAATLTVVPATTPTYVSQVIALDPNSYYRLNETGDPSTGTETVFDLWGGHNGTYGISAYNGAASIEGPRPAGGFEQFEATNTALQPTLDLAESWATVAGPSFTGNTATIVAWINPNTLVTNAGIVFARAGQPATGLNLGGTLNLGYHWLDTAASYSWDSGLSPQLNQWSLAAIVVEPDKATAYLIDSTGTRSATNVVTHASRAFTDNIRIGGDPNSAMRTFDGRIDEVAIFDHALTAAQIESLYTGEAVVGDPTLNLARNGDQITITWDGPGTLQSTTALQGSTTQWTTETTTGSSFTTTATGAAKFFRVAR
jgi:hypothetical protein